MDTNESTPGPSQFNYPESMKVYGMIIDDRISSPLVRVGLRALHEVDADLLVFLCLATDDIRVVVDTAIHGAEHVEQNLADLGSSANLFHRSAGAMLDESGGLSRDAARLGDEVREFIRFIKAA